MNIEHTRKKASGKEGHARVLTSHFFLVSWTLAFNPLPHSSSLLFSYSSRPARDGIAERPSRGATGRSLWRRRAKCRVSSRRWKNARGSWPVIRRCSWVSWPVMRCSTLSSRHRTVSSVSPHWPTICHRLTSVCRFILTDTVEFWSTGTWCLWMCAVRCVTVCFELHSILSPCSVCCDMCDCVCLNYTVFFPLVLCDEWY